MLATYFVLMLTLIMDDFVCISFGLFDINPFSHRVLWSRSSEYKDAFALFDKKGTGAVPREVLGDLLRALGQNPTQTEVADIVASAPRDGACAHVPLRSCCVLWF